MTARPPSLLLLLGPLALLVVGCGSPGAPAGERAPTSASADELRELARLAEVVAVGEVMGRSEEPRGVLYEVRLIDLLKAPPEPAPSHPVEPGRSVIVSSFLFVPGRGPRDVGALARRERYLFFTAPTERAGEWLNLADPADFQLPSAADAVQRLRAELAERQRED